jgi:hypothetical protein
MKKSDERLQALVDGMKNSDECLQALEDGIHGLMMFL